MRPGFRSFHLKPAQKGRHTAPGRKKFAPLDGRIRASGEWGANPGPFRRHRAGKKLAPLNGGIRARREWGANPGPGVRPERGAAASRAVKSLLPWMEK